MSRTRFLTGIVLLPLVIGLILLGGVGLFAFVILILTLAVIEFCRLMERDRYQLSPFFAVALLEVLLVDAQFPHWGVLGPGVSLVLMGSLVWQLAHREGSPVAEWALEMAGSLYVGWMGGYLLRLRALPDGAWWLLTTLGATWLADSAAYFIGRNWGRHRMTPQLSPNKTWEGYVSGVVAAGMGGAGLAALFGFWSGPSAPNPVEGLFLGLFVSSLSPLGDLIISMIKRHVGAKDTGSIFPGHGGALDRVDSLLWAGILGYYLAVLLRLT